MSGVGEDILDTIKKAFDFKGNRPIIVCLGNEFRNDDGIGPYIAKRIRNETIKVIDAGQVLENYITDIINYKPTDIILIDAGLFGAKVGEIKILDEKNLSHSKMLSTHSIPINTLLDFIRAELAGVNITLLAIQVSDIGFGENITKEVMIAGDIIIDYLNNLKRH